MNEWTLIAECFIEEISIGNLMLSGYLVPCSITFFLLLSKLNPGYFFRPTNLNFMQKIESPEENVIEIWDLDHSRTSHEFWNGRMAGHGETEQCANGTFLFQNVDDGF